LNTTYGGDGINTFALPDLRGRTPINQGQGPGLSAFSMGQRAGNATASLTTMNLPAHVHTLNSTKVSLNANDNTADEQSPSGNHFANAANAIYTGNGGTPGANIAGIQVSGTTDQTGQGTPFDVQNPYSVVNYSIAVNGIYPPRP
jgi:microcystin-dependent protein